MIWLAIVRAACNSSGVSKISLSKLRKLHRLRKGSLRWLILCGLVLVLMGGTAGVYRINHHAVTTVPAVKLATKDKESEQPTSQNAASASTQTAQTPAPTTPVTSQPTTPKPSVVPFQDPPPKPFGVSGGTLYQVVICKADANTINFYIGNVTLGFTSDSGGQLTYWLEGTNIENLGSLADHHTATVPAGSWSGSLNQFSGPYQGPHQLYSATIDISSGDTGSVRVAVQWAGGIWYTPSITLPGTATC